MPALLHRAVTCSALLVAVVLAAPPALAWLSPDPPARYTLGDEATSQEGCFDPCECPILVATAVEGSFLLARLEPEGAWQHYEVLDVAWIVPMYDGSRRHVSGWGTYRIDPVARTQQMALDLRIDERELQHFDSRVVEVTADWPAIELLVSINQLFCYDVVFEVRAIPVGSVRVGHRSSWGTVKRAFVR
jgi:hypothetical protein